MTRPLRIEYENALYHVTARGNRRDAIFRGDSDRLTWLSILGETCTRFDFDVLAYCQMGNHYHAVIETPRGNLCAGMRYFNGCYSQYFNRRHRLVGHVFQGRYKAIVCQQEEYLLRLSRYVMLNPVRAHMVNLPEHWAWSSYRATMGFATAPAWLYIDRLLAHFADDPEAFARFVAEGIGEKSPLLDVKDQIMLGDEPFRQQVADATIRGHRFDVGRVQRQVLAAPLHDYFRQHKDPREAMARAYLSLDYTMVEIASYARVSPKTVSRAVKLFQESIRAD